MSEQVTLEDAIRNASLLELFARPDHQPLIEACHQPIRYVEQFHSAFKDKAYFVGPLKKFTQDATDIAEIDEFLEIGEKFACELYTWRAVSRGIPQVKSNDDPNRNENYDLTVEVLKPEVDKLLKFMDFCHLAVKRFVEILQRCVGHSDSKQKSGAHGKEFVSEALLIRFAKMLDMFCILDELKRIKSSIKNDHAAYRRVAQFKRIMNDRESVEKSQMLAMFLATNYEISNRLKHWLYIGSAEFDFTEILCEIVNLCASHFENESYIFPSEKFMLVRVLGYTLYILNGTGDPGLIYKLDSKKRILHLNRFDKIFKQMEVVPLFGDMQLDPFHNYVENIAEFDPSFWPARKSSQVSPQSTRLVSKINEIRVEFSNLLNDLARLKNEYIVCNVGDNVLQWPDEYCHRIANLAIQVIRSLGAWNCLLLETFSWKLGYPTDHRSNPNCPPDEQCEQYERATKYNFNSEEKLSMIELISMVKSLQAAANGIRRLFSDGIRRFLYFSIQKFSQINLRDPLRQTVKKKRDLHREMLQALRLACSDWLGGCEPANDPALRGKKDDPDRKFDIRIAKRAVYPSITQSYLMRTSIEYLAYEKSMGRGKSAKKDWDPHIVQLFETFQKQSVYWPYLVQFDQSIIECADMSAIWFREYFLELTLGKSIQFPADCSLPWILADHIVHTRHPTHLENLLYVLDVYNDSAMFALTKLKKQYLYDEIEAEVNLVFSLLLYKLGEQIYSYYKYLAGCILLDKRFRNECAQKSAYLPYPPLVRYKSLVAQRHVHLLGRYIDMKMLLSQRINIAMLRSLDTAIQLFEFSDLPNIVELEALIELNRCTHQLASDLFSIIDFDDLMAEANDTVNKPIGRIGRRILNITVDSLIKDYCYNGTTERFVKSAFNLSNSHLMIEGQRARHLEGTPPHHLWGSKALNKAFSEIFSRYSSFVGSTHFRLMARFLGYNGIATLFSHFMENIQSDLSPAYNPQEPTLLEHLRNLKSVLPASCRLPRLDFGGQALVTRYEAALKDLISCNQLLSVFAYLREFGNTLVACMLLERAMNFEEVFDLKQAGCFNNILPRPFVPFKEGESRKEHELSLKGAIRQQELRYRPWHVLGVVKAHCSKSEIDLSEQADVLTRERLCCGLSLFDTVLLKVRASLQDPFFRGHVTPGHSSALAIDDMSEFHRFWSALLFVMCIPPPGSQETVESLFGDGLIWAGCSIISLLNQQRRFKALDFCSRILSANRLNPQASSGDDDGMHKSSKSVSAGIRLEKMVERIRAHLRIHDDVFSVCDTHLKRINSGNGQQQPEGVADIEFFEPPVWEPNAQEF